MLENFSTLRISDAMYNKRRRLCGGEPGNGFEMWRALKIKHKGSGVIVQNSGIVALHTFPKCDKKANLGNHLDDWEELYDEFGQELAGAPDNVLQVVKRTLPGEIIEELWDHPHENTYDRIMAFCRRRTDHRKQIELAESAKKHILGKTRMAVMASHEEDTPLAANKVE